MATNTHQTIGLISDTHGLLRPEALRALTSCDLILHAGDVGEKQIIPALEKIAPVVAIRGNIDVADWCSALPATTTVEIGGARICMLHDLKKLDIVPAAEGYNFVVSGHSHKASQFWKTGVLYVNPGSAGPRRFKLPITVARLELREQSWRVMLIDLQA